MTEQSLNIFFPIDGFSNRNEGKVLAARDELARLLQEIFAADVKVGWVDKANSSMPLN